jgi:GNAT superfamily N-acetyltransferase
MAAVKEVVWPREAADMARITAVIQRTDHTTLVATLGAQIVGFIDAFSTRSAAGELRWEVDLLAVHTASQGRGIGRALVAAVTQVGCESGADSARALVQIRNTASQRVFAGCGYVCDETVRELFVAAHPIPVQPGAAGGENLIPVWTFNYTGLWLEGRLTAGHLQNALGILAAMPEEYLLAGAVIPAGDAGAANAALSLGYERVAAFHWWRKDFRS